MALAVAGPAFAQEVAQTNSGPSSNGGDSMAIPPPISGVAYPVEVGAETRSNYLRSGLNVETGYVNNLHSGTGTPIAEATYSILPTISLDQSTARQHTMLSYNPGFAFYSRTTELNQVDQDAAVSYTIRLTPHSSLNADDRFLDSSTAFGRVDATIPGSVTGSSASSTPGITPPFGRRLTNSGNAEYTLQTGRNSMIGASGVSTVLNYPNPVQVSGLYDSRSRGGSAFFNGRIAGTQYFGANYQYLDMLAYPMIGRSETQTHTLSFFYTVYPKRALSLSLLGGPQYYEVAQSFEGTFSSWAPSVSASIGWQGVHTSVAASYSQSVTGGGGLLGAYISKIANATARWQLSRTWFVGASGSYSIIKEVTPQFSNGTQDGDTVSGSVTSGHSIGQQLSLGFEYQHLHQNYSGIAALANNPNADRAMITLAWHFMRALGR